jgi:hypothetical protein
MRGLQVIGNARIQANFTYAPHGVMTAMAGVWIAVDGGTTDALNGATIAMPSGMESTATTTGARPSLEGGNFAAPHFDLALGHLHADTARHFRSWHQVG